MHLTSEQITRKTFVIRGQGYDRDEVAAFLRLVAEQLPGPPDANGVQRTTVEESQLAEVDRMRTEAETYARHVREAADAYARETRRKADEAAAIGYQPSAPVVPITSRHGEPAPVASEPDQSIAGEYDAAPAAVTAPQSGLPSSGMASLDSLVDDVMADVRADIRIGSQQALG